MSDLRKLAIRLASALPEGSQERRQVLTLLDTRTAATLPRPRRNTRVGDKFRQVARKYIYDKAMEEMTGIVPHKKIREFYDNRTYDVSRFDYQTDLVDWLTGRDKHGRPMTFPEMMARWMDQYGEDTAILAQEVLAEMEGLSNVQVSIAMTVAMGSPSDDWGQKLRSEIADRKWTKDKLVKMLPAFKWVKTITIPTF